jgi:hypothetical protein
MARLLSLIALCALAAFAVPAAAQQDTSGGRVSRQQRATQDAKSGVAQDTMNRQTTQAPGAAEMGADSAMLGRQGEGVTPPGGANVSARNRPTGGGADTSRATTGGYEQNAGNEGGNMPTTGSDLPLLILAGAALVGLGVALRRWGGSRA